MRSKKGSDGNASGGLGDAASGPGHARVPSETDPASLAAPVPIAPTHRPKRFVTSYSVNGEGFCSHVFATDFDHAREICSLRNIGETVDGFNYGDPELFPLDLVSRIHTACHLSWIAARAGLIDAVEALSDRGIVHNTIHLLNGDRSTTIDMVDEQLNRLMEIVPGYLPPKISTHES